MTNFTELFEDCTSKGKKIKKEDYLENGKYPIIDQGQEQIAGYSDDEQGLFTEVPAIVFGDHTRIIKYIHEPFFLGADGVKVLRCKNDDANYKYLYYALKNAKIPNTGYNRHFKWLKETKIAYPDIIKQDQITLILDKLSKIIDYRKQQLDDLDNLIKSRFVEMFGDPIENLKGWKEINIADILSGKTSNGFFAKRDDYCDNGNISVLGVANIVNRMYSEMRDLPKTNADKKDIEKYEVKYGDMLFCRSSLVEEGIGKASIVPFDAPQNILFECHVIRLQLDTKKCVPEYIQMLTTTAYFRNQILRHAKTSTMTTIGQDGILSSMILLPPLEEQNMFLNFIRQVDKLKVEVQKSLDESQILFDSLMQKYFS